MWKSERRPEIVFFVGFCLFVCLFFTKKDQYDCGTENVIWGICQN